jgi:hypothetical protein
VMLMSKGEKSSNRFDKIWNKANSNLIKLKGLKIKFIKGKNK